MADFRSKFTYKKSVSIKINSKRDGRRERSHSTATLNPFILKIKKKTLFVFPGSANNLFIKFLSKKF